MAEAPEEVHMQSAVVCDTCENTAQHFCNTCHDKLCTRCKGIHAKSKSSFDHDVTRLTFDSLSLSAELPSPQVCRSHPGSRANVCCRKCEIPVCEKCLIGEHNGHQLVGTQELFLKKKEKLEQKFSFLESELPKYQTKLKEIKESEEKRNERQELLESEIIAHIEDVKSKLESEKNLLLKRAKCKTEIEKMALKVQESQVLGYLQNIQSFVTDFKDDATRRNTFILYTNTAIGPTVPERFPHFQLPCIPQFSKGTLDENLKDKLLGRICLNTEGIQIQDFMELESIPAGIGAIESLAYQLNDDTFWVFSQGEASYKKCNRNGTVICNVDTEAARLINKPICVSSDGHNVFMRTDTRKILQLNQDRETEFVNVQSDLPICICSNKDDGLLLGMVDMAVTEGKILRLDKQGECTQVVKDSLLFQYLMSTQEPRQPIYIAENINGDICISNKEVDVFNRNGDFRFSYNARGREISSFLPRGICTDILGHILVADKNNCCIHILDIDGQFLGLSVIQGLEDESPVTLTIDVNYCLCVGCSDGKIRVFKYIE